MYQSKYFKLSEFQCKCKKCQDNNIMPVVDERLFILLDNIREKMGCPVIVNSGYRCHNHNAAVGGVPDSQHVLGKAADIYVLPPNKVTRLHSVAQDCNADGIGFYPKRNFVHVDVRGYRARWEG